MTAADLFVGPSIDWFSLSPLLVLLGGALVLLVVGALTPRWPRSLYAFVTATTGRPDTGKANGSINMHVADKTSSVVFQPT